MSQTATNPHRLPGGVVPSRYEIRLEPDLSTFQFTGEETIAVEVGEQTDEIVLHAAELAIEAVAAEDARGESRAATPLLEPETERLRCRFQRPLPPGPWRLRLRFRGALNDQLRGFYRSRIKGGDGREESFLAVTQFEATDARRAFPCWDEPAFKAVFQVTLVIPEGLTAVSNSRLLEARALPGTGKQTLRFAPTIPMSTYLVAWVVGRLVATERRTGGATPIRVFCAPGKERLATAALEVAAFSLSFFESYYGIPYPGDKLDLIAIPDFAFGAMENLGAITFRETALLLDEATASHAERVRVAEVVAHEIAHMWFGDLVTMAWWNGLWLNEAFATFMEVQAVDAWRPAWERWSAFSVARAAALAVDGLGSSRPVEFPVAAPRDAEAMFDVLTYEKGGAVLRMLEQYLTPERFRAGIRRYLTAHRFGCAETADLWRALGEASGEPIPEIMDGWIFQEGYPLVQAELAEDGRGVTLAQSRFTYLPETGGGGRGWKVPITLRAGTDGAVQRRRILLDGPEVRLEFPAGLDWLAVNDGGHGFYRVGYGPRLLARLLGEPAAALLPVERFNLLNDCWAMALAGRLPLRAYLELTTRFRCEEDRHVWTVLLSSLAALDRVIRAEARPGLAALVRDRLGEAAARLGVSPAAGEGALTRQLRGEILQLLGTLGEEPGVVAWARELYAAAARGAASIDPDLLSAVVAILGRHGDVARYDEFLARFRAAATPQEEQRFLLGLAAFREPALVERTLLLALTPEVRSQDAPLLLRSLLLGVSSRERAWEFVKGRWEALTAKLPALTGLRRMCEGITGLATPELEADVRAFFAARPVALGGKTLEQYLEQLRIMVRFGERERAALEAALGPQPREGR